jgi:hypothetical protein
MNLCECGCGQVTKGGGFLPGHDQRLRAGLEREMIRRSPSSSTG